MFSYIKTQWWKLRSDIERGESNGHRYAGLDLLRGVAALVVVLKHFETRLDLPYLAPNGYLAVDFFFVLSGFVIASAYERQLADGTLSAAGFFWKRWIRLMPLIFIGMMVSVIAQFGRLSSEEADHLKDVAVALIFGMSMIPILQTSFLRTPTLEQSVFPLNTPMWSLFFEVFANAAFAVFARLRRPSWGLPLIILGSGVWLLFAIESAGSVNFGFNPNGFWLGFPRVMWSFSIGMLIYRYRSLAPRNLFLPASLVLVGTLLMPALGLPTFLTDTAIVVLVMPAIIFASISANLGTLARRCAAWGGNISYPLYALHYPLVHIVSYVAKGHNLSWMSQLGVVLTGTVFIVIFSAIVYTTIDIPVRRRLGVLMRRA